MAVAMHTSVAWASLKKCWSVPCSKPQWPQTGSARSKVRKIHLKDLHGFPCNVCVANSEFMLPQVSERAHCSANAWKSGKGWQVASWLQR
jgi:hypothetical protein